MNGKYVHDFTLVLTCGEVEGNGSLGSMAEDVDATHGAYVVANGGSDDAAHSCIGIPVQANS